MGKVGDALRSKMVLVIVAFASGISVTILALGTDSRAEPWGFGWTAVGSIATAAAVVLALFLPWHERRLFMLREEDRRDTHTKLLASGIADRVYRLHAQLTLQVAIISSRIRTEKRMFPPTLADQQNISFHELEDVMADLGIADWDLLIESVRTRIATLGATRRGLISLTTMIYQYPYGGFRSAKDAIAYRFVSIMELIEATHKVCELIMKDLEPYLPEHMKSLGSAIHRQGATFSSFGDLGRNVTNRSWVFLPDDPI